MYKGKIDIYRHLVYIKQNCSTDSWHPYGASPIPIITIKRAAEVIKNVLYKKFSILDIGPGPNEEIQINVNVGSYEVEIIVYPQTVCIVIFNSKYPAVQFYVNGPQDVAYVLCALRNAITHDSK